VAVALVSILTEWSFFFLAPIGVTTTVIAGYLASQFMSPPPPEKIRGLVRGHGEITAFRER
jgi:hypothetical protein